MELIADTGSPFPIIIGEDVFLRFVDGDLTDVDTNFGVLVGGWVRLEIPEGGFGRGVCAYAADAVVKAVRESGPDFDGLAGLPLLRMLEYGGDARSFWIRNQAGSGGD